MPPALYTWHTYDGAASIFGPADAAEALCDGQWLIFADVVVCLAPLGEAPAATHFENGGWFCWVAVRAYTVSDRPYGSFVPAQVVGPEAKSRAIHLFVRPLESSVYMYVGALEPSYMQALGPGGHGMARFALRPALPSAIWRELGGFEPGDIDAAAVDAALERLRGAAGVGDRLDVLRTLVDYWHAPIRPEDAIPEAELGSVPIPEPLRWYYSWAGRRPEILSGQNTLYKPRDAAHPYWQLSAEDGRLHFYAENQGVYLWSTLPEGEDPPVFGRESGEDMWQLEGITLSEHLILACLFEAVIGAKYGASAAWLEGAPLAAITREVSPIAIAPWRWGETRFHAGKGAFMFVQSNGGGPGASVWIGAKTEYPLKFLKPFLNVDDWEHIAV